MKIFAKHNLKYTIPLFTALVFFIIMLFPTSGDTFGFVSQFANMVVGGFFSLIPFSVMTLAILLVPLFVGLFVWRFVTNKKRHTLKTFCANVLLAVCIVYIWFACLLGLNYRKTSVYDQMGLPQVEVSVQSVEKATSYAIDLLNKNASQVEFDGKDRNLVVPDGYDKDKVVKIVNDEIKKHNFDFLYDFDVNAKYTFVPNVLSIFGFDGVYFPLFAELNIDSSVKVGNLSVLLTHETIHAKGILNEEQTEFLSQYICATSSNPILGYGGSYTATIYLLKYLKNADDNSFKRQLDNIQDEPLRERMSFVVRKLLKQEDKGVTSIANVFYDLYLRSNFVDGINAYDNCINGWVRYVNTIEG